MAVLPFVPRTFFNHGASRLAALCDAIRFDDALRARSIDLFRRMTSPWGGTLIRGTPPWRSDITDDHTPYEFSLALEQNEPELRMLVEAQGAKPHVAAQWRAGRALCDQLERDWGVSLDRLRAIEDLFVVEDPSARFGLWHAAILRAGTRPQFKIYLNPQAKGRGRAAAVAGAALARLGFPGVLDALLSNCDGATEIKYFSIDLHASEQARVKVYLACHHATCADIESLFSMADRSRSGEAAEFCRAMGRSDGPYLGLPVQLCFSFTTSGGSRPAAATVYFPIRAYVESDDEARDLIVGHMDAEDRPLYARVLQAFATRALDSGTGMQTYASYRLQSRHRRMTIYLSPEAYQVGPRRVLDHLAPVSGKVVRCTSVEQDAEAPSELLRTTHGR